MKNEEPPQRRMPTLAEIRIRDMTPEEIVNTRWVVDLNALAKTLESNVDILARMVPDQTLVAWRDQIALHCEVTDEMVQEVMSTALTALWIRGIRREVDQRARAATLAN